MGFWKIRHFFGNIFKTKTDRCLDVIAARNYNPDRTKFDKLMDAYPLQYAMMSEEHTPEKARDCNIHTFVRCLNRRQITEEEYNKLIEKNLEAYNKITGKEC